MSGRRVLDCGDTALLVECGGPAEAARLAERLRALRPEAVDVVPAARTVLVGCDRPADLHRLRTRVRRLLAEPDRSESGRAEPSSAEPGGAEAGSERDELVLDVVYDGPDLDEVADLAGCEPAELVARHTAIRWRGAFGGFAPGFCYLLDDRELAGPGRPGGAVGSGGTDPVVRLPTVPRLSSPRTAVPAGSVALADRFCGVYPAAGPGGWRLIGRTDARLWDSGRTPPALVAPGRVVRFRDVGATGGAGDAGCAGDPGATAGGRR